MRPRCVKPRNNLNSFRSERGGFGDAILRDSTPADFDAAKAHGESCASGPLHCGWVNARRLLPHTAAPTSRTSNYNGSMRTLGTQTCDTVARLGSVQRVAKCSRQSSLCVQHLSCKSHENCRDSSRNVWTRFGCAVQWLVQFRDWLNAKLLRIYCKWDMYQWSMIDIIRLLGEGLLLDFFYVTDWLLL